MNHILSVSSKVSSPANPIAYYFNDTVLRLVLFPPALSQLALVPTLQRWRFCSSKPFASHRTYVGSRRHNEKEMARQNLMTVFPVINIYHVCRLPSPNVGSKNRHMARRYGWGCRICRVERFSGLYIPNNSFSRSAAI
jgi:hypothetical protein